MIRHLLLTLAVLAAPFAAKHFPSGDRVDACDNEIVMHELNRMQGVENMVFDHIETDMELDESIRSCHDELGHEMARRDVAEAQLPYAVPPLLSPTHLREDYFREQRLLGALEERDRQRQRAEAMEELHSQCEDRLWVASETRLTEDHIERDQELEDALRRCIDRGR